MSGSNRRRVTNRRRPKGPAENAAVMRAMVIMLVVMTVIAAVLGYVAFSGSEVNGTSGITGPNTTTTPAATGDQERMQAALDTDKIYDNIFINGINIGSKTRADAEKYLTDKLIAPLNDKTLILSYAGESYKFTFNQFDAGYDIESALNEAFGYAREGFLEDRYAQLMSLKSKPLEIPAGFTFSESALRSAITSLGDKINIPAKDATIKREGGEFIITAGTIGKRVDINATCLLAADVLKSMESGAFDVVVIEDMPRYTESDMLNSRSLIGKYQTRAAAGDADRDINISTALTKINNAIIYPGETFSTNEYFGDMTYDNGYRMANVIIGGVFEKGMGGGVCQVSSTLYMALLNAELEIVERQNHSLKVSYVDYGFDATLNEPIIDLKFRNDTNYPVIIEGIMSGRDVIVNIYGYEIHPSGRTLEFNNNLLATVPAPEEQVIEDDTKPLGLEEIETPARDGYRYELIKTVYENGVKVSSDVVNRSSYRATAGVKRIGTNPDIPMPVDLDNPTEENPTEENPTEENPTENPPPVENPPEEEWPDGVPRPADLDVFTAPDDETPTDL